MSTERTRETDAAASDWLIRRDSGVWTPTDQARLEEWLNASALNRVAFLRLELAWEDAARLKALGAGVAGDRPPPPGSWNLSPFFDPHSSGPAGADAESVASASSCVTPRATQHRVRQIGFAVAATVLLVAGMAGYLVLSPNGERYSTPVGGLATVPMADGSNVVLNTDSQIRVALSETERRVELGHGEAFFEVSKDPNRPFIVGAGDKRVIAVGTQFSVRRDGESVEVIVTEGKVRIEDEVGTQSAGPGQSADVFLTPGSIARATPAGVLVQRKTLPEAEEHLSWRNGVLMFRDQSLGEAIAEFNRYNVRKIVIQDPSISALKIEGNFRATNVEAFVRLLESGFPVRAQAQADQILLTAK